VNFDFRVGDVVEFSPSTGRGEGPMELVRRFVPGVFHARTSDGRLLRVRTSQLVRLRRPSDEVEAAEVAKRRAEKVAEMEYRKQRVADNVAAFSHLGEIGIRLTAKGLPDRRCKPKYTASTSPVAIRQRGRNSI